MCQLGTAHSSAPECLKGQFVGKVTEGHRIGQVLFVGKDQQYSILQLILLQLCGEEDTKGLRQVATLEKTELECIPELPHC